MAHFVPKRLYAGLIVVVITAVLVLPLFVLKSETAYRQSLPRHSLDVKEERVDLFVDHIYFLSAQIESIEFDRYINKLGMDEASHLENLSRSQISSTMAPVWWPDVCRVERYFSVVHNDLNVRAFYLDGRVYLIAYTT